MTTTASVPVRFSPTGGLRALAGFGVLGLGLSTLGLATGVGVPCPWRMLTGTLCPLCGGTHVGMALLRGDLAGAWQANPFVLVGLLILTLLGVLWTVEALGGPAVRPPKRLRTASATWWLILAVAAVGFTLWRNLA